MVLLELKNAKVELEVKGGKSNLYINGYRLHISNDAASALIFEDSVLPTPKPGIAKTTSPPKRGCQSPASREKLSKSLRRWHAKRRKEKEQTTKTSTKKHLNGKSHLNGLHVN